MRLRLRRAPIPASVSRSERRRAQKWRAQRRQVNPEVLPPTAAREGPSSAPVPALRVQRVRAMPVVVLVMRVREALRRRVAVRRRVPAALLALRVPTMPVVVLVTRAREVLRGRVAVRWRAPGAVLAVQVLRVPRVLRVAAVPVVAGVTPPVAVACRRISPATGTEAAGASDVGWPMRK
jgi:hypothetical protein